MTGSPSWNYVAKYLCSDFGRKIEEGGRSCSHLVSVERDYGS
jgi:hypothetical protein